MSRGSLPLPLRWVAECALALLVLLGGIAFASAPSNTAQFAHNAAQLPHSAAPIQSAPARIAFLGDPQIGYTSLEGDFLRFGQVLRAAEATPASALIIAGDLTQDHNLVQRWLIAQALARVRLPVHLVPGNHDVDDLASLELFRRQFGPDYSDFVVGDVAFLLLNSETARSVEVSASEYARQWTFIEQTLRKHQQTGHRTVLVMHRPPFVRHENESGSRANWPPEARKRLLDLCRTFGVNLLLAGHLHWTNVVQTQDGIQIRVLPGSARSFDRSSIGFELLSLDKTSTDVRFIQVAPPPTVAFSVPGLRGWTPRLFDFSVRHWLFTALFGLAGACALRARRRIDGAQQQREGGSSGQLFEFVGWMMIFYGANMQLDLDEFVLETGRIFAKMVGVSSIRHWITGSSLVVLVCFGLFGLSRALRTKHPWRELAAAGACAVPTAWFILSSISHHHLRMLFDQFYWDVLNLIAVGVIIYTARTARPINAARPTHAAQPPQRLA